MDIVGEYRINARREAVWEALAIERFMVVADDPGHVLVKRYVVQDVSAERGVKPAQL